MIIAFSNAFHESTYKFKYHPDPHSYIIFGGYNESQIVGGAKGLFNMPLAGKELNPTLYWGVEGQGMLYGNDFIMDPEKKEAVLSVIDSGTTLVLLPKFCYEGVMNSIAKKVQNDPKVSFVCSREEKNNNMGACYFNNTRCEDVTDVMEPMKFIFGRTVFEIKIDAFLKDVTADGKVPQSAPEKEANYKGGCMLEFRPNKDDK